MGVGSGLVGTGPVGSVWCVNGLGLGGTSVEGLEGTKVASSIDSKNCILASLMQNLRFC